MAVSSKGTEFRIVIIFVVLILAYFGYQKYLQPVQQKGKRGQLIYDTNQQNDKFIKGNLNSQQLAQFDKILELEKAQSGFRLSAKDLKRTAKDDKALYEAYSRWRKCKDMMRSNHRTIYPSERKYFQK